MFVRGGATFANMARLSAAGIPVISIVHGSSTAGGAYQTGLADYVVMVRGRSKVFLAGPPLLKAATGEIAGDEALGGAELHCVDHRPRRISRRGRRRRAAHRPRDPRPHRLAPVAAAPPCGAAALRSRGIARDRAGRLPQALRRARGDRALGRRLRVSRLQAVVRARRPYAVTPRSRAARSASSATTAPSIPPAPPRPDSSSNFAASRVCRSSSCRTPRAIWSAWRPKPPASSSTARR